MSLFPGWTAADIPRPHRPPSARVVTVSTAESERLTGVSFAALDTAATRRG